MKGPLLALCYLDEQKPILEGKEKHYSYHDMTTHILEEAQVAPPRNEPSPQTRLLDLTLPKCLFVAYLAYLCPLFALSGTPRSEAPKTELQEKKPLDRHLRPLPLPFQGTWTNGNQRQHPHMYRNRHGRSRNVS